MISANLSSHHTNSIHANNDTHTNDNEAQVHINSSSCADDMANNHNHDSNRNQNYNSTCNMKSGHKKSTHKLLTQKKKSVVDK